MEGLTRAEIDPAGAHEERWRCRTSAVAASHAIDIRLHGFDMLTLYNASIARGRHGVGYYPHSAFVHVDTDRIRTWCYGCSLPHQRYIASEGKQIAG